MLALLPADRDVRMTDEARHMAMCTALGCSTQELEVAVGELERIWRPSGDLLETFRCRIECNQSDEASRYRVILQCATLNLLPCCCGSGTSRAPRAPGAHGPSNSRDWFSGNVIATRCQFGEFLPGSFRSAWILR